MPDVTRILGRTGRLPLFLLALTVLGIWPRAAADEERGKDEGDALVRARLEAIGFAVDERSSMRLHGIYRDPPGPVFVTADSALGGYLLLLRRGMECLQGALSVEVLFAYREVVTDAFLDDAAWQERRRAKALPPPPAWTTPYLVR